MTEILQISRIKCRYSVDVENIRKSAVKDFRIKTLKNIHDVFVCKILFLY